MVTNRITIAADDCWHIRLLARVAVFRKNLVRRKRYVSDIAGVYTSKATVRELRIRSVCAKRLCLRIANYEIGREMRIEREERFRRNPFHSKRVACNGTFVQVNQPAKFRSRFERPTTIYLPTGDEYRILRFVFRIRSEWTST